MKHIIGWQRNRIPLAAFFVILGRRTDELTRLTTSFSDLPGAEETEKPDELTPFTMFFSGLPGTGKTEGALRLAQLMGKTVALVDSSTLDDIAELAGVPDMYANRELGKNRLILGDLLRAEILVLDEFLNTRPHVMAQFRLMLQGKLIVCGNPVPMATKAIIGTGNLAKDLLAGVANEVDSPTADRWALIVETPSLGEMTSREIDAILDDEPYGDFAGVLQRTVAAMQDNLGKVQDESSQAARLYVRTMVTQFEASSPFAFQGRRAKLLKSFVLAILSLCRSQADLDLDESIWKVVSSCLTYHRLSGLNLDMEKLQSAHKLSMSVLREALKNKVEAFIAAESSLAAKIGLIVCNKSEVTAVTKAEVFGQVAQSGDLALLTACRILVQSPWGMAEPVAMADLLRTGKKPTKEFFAGLNGMTLELAANWLELSAQKRMQWWTRWLNDVYAPEINGFMATVRTHLESWGLSTELEEVRDDGGSVQRAVIASANT